MPGVCGTASRNFLPFSRHSSVDGSRKLTPRTPGGFESWRLHRAGGILISLPVFFSVQFFPAEPRSFLVVFERRGRRCRLRLLPGNIAKALKVQSANPVFHRQFPLLPGIGPGSNQTVRTKAQTLGHGDVVLVELAEFFCLRPVVPLWLLPHHEPE